MSKVEHWIEQGMLLEKLNDEYNKQVREQLEKSEILNEEYRFGFADGMVHIMNLIEEMKPVAGKIPYNGA